jgi:hypothetical protein
MFTSQAQNDIPHMRDHPKGIAAIFCMQFGFPQAMMCAGFN